MGKDKKFLDAEKNVASSVFQKRNEYKEAHKEEEVVIEEPEEEKKLISTNNFGGKSISDDATKYLGIEKAEPLTTAAKAKVKLKELTEKELEEQNQLENEKINVMAGLRTMGGIKPSLIKEDEPEEEIEVKDEEEEIDYSYDVTSQFYTQAIKPIDKSPKK